MTYLLLAGGVAVTGSLRRMPAVAMLAALSYLMAGMFVLAVLHQGA